MATDVKVEIGAEFVGRKAFSDAVKQTVSLDKQVKTLAKSYLGLFTAQRIGYAGINAAKAFAADDKAARVLTRSLDNLGLAFADPQVKNFIADLEKQFGVLDDQLRPAFQRLLTTTGDVAKSQSLLRTALDLSAASGQDVVTVAGDLSKGYVGQTRALAKYGIGLTQAQLKAMTFEETQARINQLFGGQAQVAVDTYAGKFDRLNVATKNFQETLGKGILDFLTYAGGGGTQGFDNTLSFMDSLAQKAAKFQRNFGIGIGQFLALLRGDLAAAKALGEAANATAPFMGAIPSIQSEVNKKAAWDRINQYKKEAALALKLAAAKKAELKAAKEQETLKKAGTLFDVQQAQIIAALKGDISAEERKRLELQLAILTGNTTEASKLAAELGKAQGLTKELIAYYSNLPDAKNPFSGWITTLLNAQQLAASIAAGNYQAAPISSIAGNQGAQYSLPMASTFTSAAGVDVTVNVNAGTVIAEEGLKDVIRDSLLNDSLQAKFAAIYRQGGLGSFG